jgi:dephospho-CoA kinase
MIKLAVTGNIGSGKTTVCKIFESLGVPVYYADIKAKKLYSRDNVITRVKELFGESIFDHQNKLRPSVLAQVVFNDPDKLQKLNQVIHPLVLDDFLLWVKEHNNKNYIIYESALLFESGFVKHFDKSILVTSPQSIAKMRVMKRDGIAESEFMARASQQNPEKEKELIADYIIRNDESTPLIPQVIAIHNLLLNLGK